jgi:quinol-cytochrome oxidoreductase complex cytochrome b subunit
MNITRKAQEIVKNSLSLEDALPTKMPVYVNSVTYLFGVLTLSSLVMLFITGPILAIFGPDWYHISPEGRFVNAMHFWSTQVFFTSMILHLATKFFMAAWRDGRWKTWMVGMLTLAIAIFTALTGYLSQTNWDSQWIAVQAKDAMNAIGVGEFFNTMNTGQVLTLHIAVLPAIILVLVGLHIILIRSDGPVKPMPDPQRWVEPDFVRDVEWIFSGKAQPPKRTGAEGQPAEAPEKRPASGENK